MLADWAIDARTALGQGPAALVSVLATAGSAPRAAGTRMVVAPRRIWGTIGGGLLEQHAIDAARTLLTRPPGSWQLRDYRLGSGRRLCPGPLGCRQCGCAQPRPDPSAIALAQCCGGRARVLLERLDPDQAHWLEAMAPGRSLLLRLANRLEHAADDAPAEALSARGPRPGYGTALRLPVATPPTPLYLFGAGHVGRAIVQVLHELPFALHWFDSRADTAAATGARLLDPAQLETVLERAPAQAMVLILSHDHALDYRLTRAALARPLAFVGLIGSASKRARFLAQLRRDGLDQAALARLVCPIGLPLIVGKEPAVIAIAVIAQLLAHARPGGGGAPD